MKQLLFAVLAFGFMPSFANACDLGKESEMIVSQWFSEKAPGVDELAQWKQWEKLLVECRGDIRKGAVQTYADFLLMGYVAYEGNGSATREYMAGEVYPLFKQEKRVFLSALKLKPQLIESACYYLGRHFSVEDESEIRKQIFLSDNARMFFKILTIEQAKRCIRYI